MKGKKALLLGGCGFYGHYLSRALVENGWSICVVDRLPKPTDFDYEYVQCDLSDPLATLCLRDLVSDVDVIFVLVGLLGSVECSRSLIDSVLQNVLPMAVLYEALVHKRVKPRVVFPSSDLVYGRVRGLCREFMSCRPVCGYARMKVAAVGIQQLCWGAYNIPFVTLRISTTYGPYQRRPSLVNHYVKAALGGGRLTVYGEGRHERGWLCIDDAVSALLLATDIPVGIYNVPGDVRTVLGVAEAVVEVIGDGEISHVDWPAIARSVDVGDSVLDGRKLQQHGWSVAVLLEKGIQKVADFYLMQGSL